MFDSIYKAPSTNDHVNLNNSRLVKECMSDSVTNYNYVVDSNISVSI